jgi:hypothetical protein
MTEPDPYQDPEDAALEAALRGLPNTLPHPLDAADTLRRARAPTPGWTPWSFGALAAAAAALLAILPALVPDDGSRTRGGTGGEQVLLEAVVDGTARPLGPGSRVQQDEAVVFRTTTPGPGTVRVFDQRTEAVILGWETEGGIEWLGGVGPVAWRPDEATVGRRRYVVEWCPRGGGACQHDKLLLSWRP